MIRSLSRGLAKSGHLLMSFLVDDTPEVLVLGALVVGAAYGLRSVHPLAYVGLPFIAVAGLAFSVWRARRPPVSEQRPGPELPGPATQRRDQTLDG